MKLSKERGVEPMVVEEVALGIVRVPLRTTTLPPATRTNAFLVRGRKGIWIVDPGSSEAAEQAVLGTAIADAERRWGVRAIGCILTHHHPDHVAGVGWLVESMGVHVVSEHRTQALVSRTLPMHEVAMLQAAGWRVFDGDAAIDGFELVFTPGHAPGHVAIWTGEGTEHLAPRVLMAGDLVAGFGTIVVNPPRGNMREYLASLARAIELGPELLLPSHGPGTVDAVARLEQYRAHRLAREAKVLGALAAEWRTSAEITAIAYDDVPAQLHFFAERSVLAHLIKLVADGAAAEESERYRLAM